MKVSLLKVLSDPNNAGNNFSVYGHVVSRDGRQLHNLTFEDMESMDDIQTGIVINTDSGNIYPVTEYVLTMLSDIDLEPKPYISMLQEALNYTPDDLSSAVRKNIERINATLPTETSKWNTEEMEYYDAAVSTAGKRSEFLENIRSTPLWNIYIDRKRHLIDQVQSAELKGEYVLEVGCGNSRTVSWIFSPKEYGYNYVGTDISLKRLILAKKVIPEGDFVQCSAYNIPFKDASFHVVIAFGVLHHLPDAISGMRICLKAIKNNGYFFIHEPIEKPKTFFREGTQSKLAKIMDGYDHSEHDKEINMKLVLAFLGTEKASIKHIHYHTSAFRTIIGRILSEFKNLKKSKAIWETILGIDNFFIGFLRNKPNILGPGAVLIVIQKE